MRHAIALIAPLALAACATTPDRPTVEGGPPLAEGSLAAVGQPVRAGELVATPQEVTEDSRCPADTNCVWAGRVVLSTRIDGPGWRETVPLTLGETYQTHGTQIVLASVQPARTTQDPIVPGEYRFAFAGGS